MIYVTGDLHGDIGRFKSKAMRKLRKNDYLLVCGDFGFLWDGSKKERRLLKWIGRRRYHVLFVEGTHDNLDLLDEYPVTEWNGGLVHEISGKLRHLCRGQVFNLEDQAIFAFGGGESRDTDSREERWWSRELPTPEEIQQGRDALNKNGNAVDYIITHQCSRRMKSFLVMHEDEVNVLDTFFDEVRETCKFKRWFFGSYHRNKIIPPTEAAIYDAVAPIHSMKF